MFAEKVSNPEFLPARQKESEGVIDEGDCDAWRAKVVDRHKSPSKELGTPCFESVEGLKRVLRRAGWLGESRWQELPESLENGP